MNKEELLLKLIEKVLESDGVNVPCEILATETGYEKYLDKKILVRTVTHHYTGHVTEVSGLSMTLDSAAWIPDEGRFHKFLIDPSNGDEVEPYNCPVTISLYAILDVTEIPKLLTEVK